MFTSVSKDYFFRNGGHFKYKTLNNFVNSWPKKYTKYFTLLTTNKMGFFLLILYVNELPIYQQQTTNCTTKIGL